MHHTYGFLINCHPSLPTQELVNEAMSCFSCYRSLLDENNGYRKRKLVLDTGLVVPLDEPGNGDAPLTLSPSRFEEERRSCLIQAACDLGIDTVDTLTSKTRLMTEDRLTEYLTSQASIILAGRLAEAGAWAHNQTLSHAPRDPYALLPLKRTIDAYEALCNSDSLAPFSTTVRAPGAGWRYYDLTFDEYPVGTCKAILLVDIHT